MIASPFIKNKERTKKFMHIGNTNYTFKNDHDKACFQHDTAYSKYKDSNQHLSNELYKSIIRKV